MIDHEVERLRRLRGSALRVRAVAAEFGTRQNQGNRALFERGCGAAWRVARTVTGRLRAHPNARYQRDAGFGMLIRNGLAAKAASIGSSSAAQSRAEFGRQLQLLLRELEDTRAMTWDADLSDTFGRSQQEIRALVLAAQGETRDRRVAEPLSAAVSAKPSHAVAPYRASARPTRGGMADPKPARGTAAVQGDWPFLTI